MIRFAIALLCLSAGCCMPKVWVVKNPNDCDDGIRYYRPKPFLLLSPAAETIAVDEKGNKTYAGASAQFVSIQLQYLPDYSEEYSIHVDPGIGVADVGVKLDNGWNLTEVNQKLDSKVPETLTALGSLAGGVGGLFKSADGPGGGAGATKVLAASDVPLGYYEAVVSRGPDGTKRLYGWRYVGFMPFNECPVESGGVECRPCGSQCLYGLRFERGVMVFRSIQKIQEDADVGLVVFEVTPEDKKVTTVKQVGDVQGDLAKAIKQTYFPSIPAWGTVEITPGATSDERVVTVTFLVAEADPVAEQVLGLVRGKAEQIAKDLDGDISKAGKLKFAVKKFGGQTITTSMEPGPWLNESVGGPLISGAAKRNGVARAHARVQN